MEIIQPSTEIVNQGRRKRMRIANRTLLSQRGLISLLETAPVRHTPENRGDELWIVPQAESEEELILLAKIGVHAGVKGVAVFPEFWGIGEIREKRGVRRRREEI